MTSLKKKKKEKKSVESVGYSVVRVWGTGLPCRGGCIRERFGLVGHVVSCVLLKLISTSPRLVFGLGAPLVIPFNHCGVGHCELW